VVVVGFIPAIGPQLMHPGRVDRAQDSVQGPVGRAQVVVLSVVIRDRSSVWVMELGVPQALGRAQVGVPDGYLRVTMAVMENRLTRV
tara:strand:- start:975 stop:1235 length:261 start_codon:yes stop_codon:yes gene_type:complete